MAVPAQPAMFIAGSLGIDFLNSVATPVDEAVDWIGNGKGFVSWLKQAGLITSNDLAIIESNFSAGELDLIARQARELREWFRHFVNTHQGRSLTAEALTKLELLNDLLGLDQIFWKVVPKPEGEKGPSPLIFRLRPQRRWRNTDSVLAPVVEEIAKTVCHVDFKFVKACQGKTCTLLFQDETRRRERRWCSMAVCGNRAKQEAFRTRSNGSKR
jgi:predicted RNA-binding Zn ribbon-like protein